MRRTAMLLSGLLLTSLLAASPALAAPAVKTAALPAKTAAATVKTAVASVKASPAKSGECPTTVGFSAVVAAKGAGTVRYRWVRGDGSKGVIRGFRVNGARRVVVKERQTFDRTTSGWQAVEILGRRGLSGKARFDVTCTGPGTVWDGSHLLPARTDRPLVAAAHVDGPPVHHGPCPTTVTFTATIQVSRTPATVDYQWIDSATGEGRPETVFFAAGGPRVRQVTLPLAVGDSTSGWKAVHILNANGHDSGRAIYQVTCQGTPPATPTPTPTPTSTQPPAHKPEAEIFDLSPGDYAGRCTEPVEYQAVGRVKLPAGPAQRVTYWWRLDATQWESRELDFPASQQPRALAVTATWKLTSNDGGSHKLTLKAEGGAAPAERVFTFSCAAQPDPARLTVRYLLTPRFKGTCTGNLTLQASGVVTTDRATTMRYRFVVDGVPGPTKTQELAPGTSREIAEVWTNRATSSGTGVVRLEVLNLNEPVKEAAYAWTCVPEDTSGAVRIRELSTSGYDGDCVETPQLGIYAALVAAAGTEVTYRWVVGGVPMGAVKTTTPANGIISIGQGWRWEDRPNGPVRFEVLSHDKPAAEITVPVTCRK
ncbi:hypothetical protein [Nonomuraea sp. NPDC003754]